MKALVLNKTGGPEVLRVTEIDKPEPADDEVLIKVKYSGMNYADILTRRGLYSWAPPRPAVMGLEVCGEIVGVGSKVTQHQVGDRVFAGMQGGGYAEYAVTKEIQAFKPPAFYTDEEVVAYGGQWITAWVALHEMARVRPGEVLLVQAAAGGVGTAAVQLAKIFGMKVYGTCSPSKREIIEELGATYVSYDNFHEEMEAPDCILESIGGDVFKRSFRMLAPMGRLITIGGSSINLKSKRNPIAVYRALKKLPKASMSQVLRRSKGFMGLHIGYLMKYPERMLPIWEAMNEVIEKHQLRPVFRKEQIFPLTKAGEAHEYMNNRKNIGKILLDPSK